jgi:hypothetical protein
MDSETLREMVSKLDVAGVAALEAAWAPLREHGVDVVPWLLDAFPSFRTWQGRSALVYHAVRYARSSEEAFQLGVLGCRDRSYVVRYRACGLLAYSQRTDALGHLEPLLSHRDTRTVEDARAATDAIESRNHHYFIDWSHSGRSFWRVNDGDE